jgi:3-hydroxyisobutyrate dehydrogenase-like beta-hydroxyacid dehydrogenase
MNSFMWVRREAYYAVFEGLEFHHSRSGIALANQVEVLCLCLVDDDGLDWLLFGEGVVAAQSVNAVVMNHGTGDPGHAAEIAI